MPGRTTRAVARRGIPKCLRANDLRRSAFLFAGRGDCRGEDSGRKFRNFSPVDDRRKLLRGNHLRPPRGARGGKNLPPALTEI